MTIDDVLQQRAIVEHAPVVLGGALSPWRLATDSLEAVRAFAKPGWVRVAAAFTRIEATDDAARRRFGRYWRVVGPFSSITRREMLAAIRRRAEA